MNRQKEYSYAIVKHLPDENTQSKVMMVLEDEILESEDKSFIQNLVKVLNDNTDNGCKYELVEIPKLPGNGNSKIHRP
tara:strand:- start:3304 stop:3537 length:234 start_codon:yes stop_codon:yes gene_type:complete